MTISGGKQSGPVCDIYIGHPNDKQNTKDLCY